MTGRDSQKNRETVRQTECHRDSDPGKQRITEPVEQQRQRGTLESVMAQTICGFAENLANNSAGLFQPQFLTRRCAVPVKLRADPRIDRGSIAGFPSVLPTVCAVHNLLVDREMRRFDRLQSI